MNLSKYDFALTPREWDKIWHIDRRHWNALHAMALHCTGNVVEIGCFRGFSTAAFTEALNVGANFDLHLVDIHVTPQLRRVIALCDKPQRIHVYETHSTEFRLPSADLWMIDADHNFAACQDVLNAIASNAEIIAMHDTNAHPEGFTECEGAYVAANALKGWQSRRYIEDKENRPREWTHRGFLASFDACTIQGNWKRKAYDACRSALDASPW